MVINAAPLYLIALILPLLQHWANYSDSSQHDVTLGVQSVQAMQNECKHTHTDAHTHTTHILTHRRTDGFTHTHIYSIYMQTHTNRCTHTPHTYSLTEGQKDSHTHIYIYIQTQSLIINC